MACIYTGAYVHFPEHGAFVSADLFLVGDCIVIQWMPESWSYDSTPDQATHHVLIGHDYHHTIRGVTVVHESQCKGPRR